MATYEADVHYTHAEVEDALASAGKRGDVDEAKINAENHPGVIRMRQWKDQKEQRQRSRAAE